MGQRGTMSEVATRPRSEASLRCPQRLPRREAALMAVAGILVPFAYALYANHIWEDYFITFRHSQNLCEGKGLLYNPGERLHGFTSPLGTLVPALCYLATGQTSYLPAMWLYRVLSILAFAGGGVLLLKAMWVTDPEDRFGRCF